MHVLVSPGSMLRKLWPIWLLVMAVRKDQLHRHPGGSSHTFGRVSLLVHALQGVDWSFQTAGIPWDIQDTLSKFKCRLLALFALSNAG